MSTKTLITRLSCGLLLTSTLLHAAPQEQNDPHNGKHGTPAAQSSQPGKPSNQQPSQGKPQAQQSQGKPQQSASKAPGQAQGGKPPSDFSSVRKVFQERRGQIGKGGNVPASVHIQAGKPLPAGYGKRLDSAQLKGVPAYSGYEWRRVGSDMVLVAITTGIVHTILSGVLN